MSDPMGALLTLLVVTAIGLQVARWLRVKEPGVEGAPTLHDGWSFLYGVAVVTLALHVPLAICGHLPRMVLAGVVLIAALIVCRDAAALLAGRGGRFHWPSWLADLPRSARLVLLIVVVLGAVHCTTSKLTGYDARTIYALKARVLFDVGSIRGEDFNDPARLHFNPGYPLGLPLLETLFYWCSASDDGQAIKLLFLAFPLALASVLAGQLRRFEHPLLSSLTAVMFLLTPVVLSCFEGAGLSGSADLPLAAMLFAGMMKLSDWLRRPNTRDALAAAILLAGAAAMKAEGLLWIMGCGAAVTLAVMLRKIRLPRTAWRSGAVGVAALALLMAVCSAVHAQVRPSGYYLSGLGSLRWDWIRQLAGRPLTVVAYIGGEFFRIHFWNLVWPCFFATMMLLRRGSLPPQVWFWRLTALGMAAAYSLVLIVTPLHVYYQLLTAVTRLMLHFYPLAVLIMGEQMAASGWTAGLLTLMSPKSLNAEDSQPVMAPDELPPAKAA